MQEVKTGKKVVFYRCESCGAVITMEYKDNLKETEIDNCMTCGKTWARFNRLEDSNGK